MSEPKPLTAKKVWTVYCGAVRLRDRKAAEKDREQNQTKFGGRLAEFGPFLFESEAEAVAYVCDRKIAEVEGLRVQLASAERLAKKWRKRLEKLEITDGK